MASIGSKSTVAWGANIFTATEASQLAAVGFYALTPNTSYTIYIYTGCSADAPTSGTLAVTQSGRTDWAGFFTIPLTTKVALSARQRFSVVLKLTTPGFNYPLAFEYAYPGYSSEATASSGQSFLSSDGSSWLDFTEWRGSANFCCKAYTQSATVVRPTLSSIAISGVSSLTSGQSAIFTCEATYSDGSKKSVSPAWGIARAGQAYATVTSGGLVTALDVSAQQTVTVQASYTEDGVTKDATWGMYVTVAAPNAPQDVTATQGTESSCVRVNWTAPSGATEYAVYRATVNSSKNAQYLDNVTVAKYNDTSAKPGIDYWYFIKAKNSSGTSGFSTGSNGWRRLSPPEGVTASDTLLDKVSLEWSEVEGATHYRVYRAASMDGAKSALGGWQTAMAFNDTTATAGVTYYYFVVAAVDASGNRPSDCSIVEDGMRAVPVTVDHLEIKGDASIAAGGYADFTADAVYTDGHKVESITPGSWSIVGDGASVANGRVTAAMITENTMVMIEATYTENGKAVFGEKQITIAAVKPVAPRNVAAAVSGTAVNVSWSAVSGASSYRVYRHDGEGSGATQVGSTSNASFVDRTAIPGVAYSYSVSAVNSAGEGPQSGTVTATIPLSEPTGVAATSNLTDGVLVSWAAVNGATHYRVARAASADGEKTELGSWQVGTSYNDTSATAGTAYWYFVRAATSSSGANASGYSSGAQGVRKVAVTLSSIAISGPDKVASSGSAVYSCTATYSDGSTATVVPIWGANGSGAIDANGRLTALEVSSDATVTVAASYGGKIATKSVKVVAPVATSATVSNVSVKPRWPFSSLVDIDYTLATAPEGTVALISLSGQDNDHNLPLAATTLTGDGAGNVVAAGRRRITWDVGADYPGFHAKSFDVSLEAVPYVIGVPSNVSASQGTSTRGVNLSWNAVEDATGYEIWRAKGTMDTAGATLVTNVGSVVTCADVSVDPGDIYFYWLKAVTQYGTGGFSGATLGYRASVTVTVTFDGNGGTPSAASISSYAGNAYGTLPKATRADYVFAGWFTAATGGEEVTATSLFDENVTTLYAHWIYLDKVQLWRGGPYWATMNIGAKRPEDYGCYFWWGDTVGYRRENGAWVASDGSSSNYSFKTNSTPTLGKSAATLQSEGWITADGVLAPAYDAAHVHWGGDWRMPTSEDMIALTNNCDWTLMTTNGVKGYLVRGKGEYASASIFFPAAGYGYETSLKYAGSFGDYWSSVPNSEDGCLNAWCLAFDTSRYIAYYYSRRHGRTVRPVQEAPQIAVTVTLDGNGGTPSAASISGYAGDAYGTLPTATRAGYAFAGWFTAATGGEKVTASSLFDENVTTLYAHWTANTHDKVQLWEGGPYWATTNIGAENPEDYGSYFWWGDTVGYKWENDAWVASDGSSSNFSFIYENTPTYDKSISALQIEGWITADGVLAPEHDAAHVQWGGNWRMPTDQELVDLNNNCDLAWTTTNGVNGYVVRGKGDYASASIFLPAAGWGCVGSPFDGAGSDGHYWASVPKSDNDYDAWYFEFNSIWFIADSIDGNRCCGRAIRPVQGYTK